jgi:hypothetical protein
LGAIHPDWELAVTGKAMPHNVREHKTTATHPNGSGLWSRARQRWRWLWTDTEIAEPDLIVAPADLKSTPEAEVTKSRSFTDLLPFKIIAWLGASAGGLTILLAVLGFLALSAHDVMLGIPRSLQNNPEYVAVGGLFFGRSIMFLVASLILAKSWIVLVILIAGAIVLFELPRHRSRGRSTVIALFSVVLLAGEVYGLARLIIPLQISNLLLNLSASGNSPARQVVDALLVNDTTWLRAEYGFLVLLVGAFSAAFLLLEQAAAGRFWPVVRVPAFLLLLICIFLLPRAYGVLTIANEYPTVSFASSDGKTANETRLLLREDDKVFVLYDPATQAIVTVKRDSVAEHTVYAPQHVFTASVGKK